MWKLLRGITNDKIYLYLADDDLLSLVQKGYRKCLRGNKGNPFFLENAGIAWHNCTGFGLNISRPMIWRQMNNKQIGMVVVSNGIVIIIEHSMYNYEDFINIERKRIWRRTNKEFSERLALPSIICDILSLIHLFNETKTGYEITRCQKQSNNLILFMKYLKLYDTNNETCLL